MRRQQQLFIGLLPEGMSNFGLDPAWVSLYPYQILAAPGQAQKIEVRAQNYQPSPMKLEVALVAPSEWRIEPEVLKFETPASGKAARAFEVTIPRGWSAPSPRLAIAADVLADGKYLGQITEAVVEMRADRLEG